MQAYIILAAFIFLVISHFACFIVGWKKGRKAAAAEYAKEKAQREKDARMYEQAKQEISQEVFKDANNKKADLAGHGSPRDQFNAINNSLSNKPQD